MRCPDCGFKMDYSDKEEKYICSNPDCRASFEPGKYHGIEEARKEDMKRGKPGGQSKGRSRNNKKKIKKWVNPNYDEV